MTLYSTATKRYAHFLLGVAILVLGIYTVAQCFVFLYTDADDAYIIYRIVKNILAGQGRAFNPGEHYNASTSALNTILIALVAWPTRNILLTAHLLGSLWIGLSGFLTYRLLQKNQGRHLGALGGGLLIIYVLANDITWGLESHLFFALSLIFVTLESLKKNSWPIIDLLILARPDGILFLVFKALHDGVTLKKLPVKGLLQVLLITVPWYLFSWWQFGQMVPNTLQAKMWQGASGFWGNGWVYWQGLKAHLVSLAPWRKLLVIGGLSATPLLIKKRSPLFYLYAFSGVQQMAYIWMNVPAYHWYFVFYDTTLVLGSLFFFGYLIQRAPFKWLTGNVVYLGTTMLLLIFGVYSMVSALKNHTGPYGKKFPYYDAVAAINHNFPQASLATLEVGALGFYTDSPILDLTGLTSPTGEFISGQKNDLFFTLLPTLVLFHLPPWDMEQAIFTDHRFPLFYAPTPLTYDPGSPKQLFVRRNR